MSMFNEEQATKVKKIIAKKKLRNDFRRSIVFLEFVIKRNAIRHDENHD